MPEQPRPEQPEQPPEVAALDLPMVPFAVGGMIVWVVALVILLPMRSSLAAHGHEDWITICWVGLLLGLPGLALMARHDANRRRRRAQKDQEAPTSTTPADGSPA